MWNVNSDGKYSCHKEFTAVDVGNLANAVYSSCLEFWVYTQDNGVLWFWWTAGYGCLLNEYNITPTPHVLWGLGFEISISKPSQRDFKSKTSGTEFQGPSKNNSLSKEVFSQDIRGEKKTWCCYFFWMNNDVRVGWLFGLFFFLYLIRLWVQDPQSLQQGPEIVSSAGFLWFWGFFSRTDGAGSPERVSYAIEPYAFKLGSAKSKTNCD